MSGDMGAAAAAYAAAGWAVFPVHPWNCPCTPAGCGKRPHTNRGVLDASTDPATISAWWERFLNANIGGRLPAGVIAIDIDPRNGGEQTWFALSRHHEPLMTRTAITGRGDGGRHMYVQHPGGVLHATLGAGVDVKTAAGYTVLPPSRHACGGNYVWVDSVAPIVPCPTWLTELLRKVAPVLAHTPQIPARFVGSSIADQFTATTSWVSILGPHHWQLAAGDGNTDGSQWRHPAATAAVSATVRHGCLFVYSPNTPFSVTAAGDAHGLTRFRAWALLNHNGDLSAAARAARCGGGL